MPKPNQKGVIPIIALIIAGIIALAGGSFAVRNNLIKLPKVTPTLTSSTKTPGPTKEPLGETFTYTPKESTKDSTTQQDTKQTIKEPKFTISPPSGWQSQNPSNLSSSDSPNFQSIKAVFFAPDKDIEKINSKQELTLQPSIGISIFRSKKMTSLDAAAENERALTKQNGTTILTDKRISLNGKDVHFFENKFKRKEGLWMHQLTYIFLAKDGFTVFGEGSALDSAWGKREPQIKSSLESIRIIEDTPSPSPKVSAQPTTSPTPQATPNMEKKKPEYGFTPPSTYDWTRDNTNTGDSFYAIYYEYKYPDKETGQNGKTLEIKATVAVRMFLKNGFYNLDMILNMHKNKGDRIISEKSININGTSGYELETVSEDPKTGVKIHSKNFIFYRGGYDFSVGVSSLESSWNKYKPIFDEVFDTFTFTN